jgi:nickel transport protein
MKKTALFITALFSASLANAHNVWLEPAKDAKGQYVVKFGHEETETYPQSKLKAVRLLDAKGQLQNATVNFKEGEAYFAAPDAAIAFIRFDNGVWSKLPSGKYVEKTKQQVPEAVRSVNPIKFGKAILHWDAQANKSHNMDYELIPQSEPKAGQPLDILVLVKGKPVQGIKVGLGEDHPFNLTNEKGIAQFTPKAGYNKVWAEFDEPVNENPDYTERSVEYMLTFDAK